MIILHFSKQGRILSSILIPSVICVNHSQLVDHLVTPHDTIEHTHAKVLVCAIERQV